MKYIQLTEAGEFFRHAANVAQTWDENNYCTPEALVADGKSGQFFVVELLEVERPQCDPVTQAIREADPVLQSGAWFQRWELHELSAEEIEANKQALVPKEVSMGQCRLALFDLHEIKTDAQFYALADVLPEELRPRARLQLSTRQSVRYDNELVIAFCEAKGWDREALFVYGAAQ